MRDRELEAIRERDKSFKYLPDHYQGPRDRRYLLKVIDDLLREKKPNHNCGGFCDNYPDKPCMG